MVTERRGGKKKAPRASWIETWADARALAIDEETFWRCTPYELTALLEAITRRERARQHAAALRAGLVAATIRNVHRGKGGRHYRPEDFVRNPDAGAQAPTREELQALAHRMAPTPSIRR